MFRIKFSNSNESAIFVQVDPWAGLYKLGRGEQIEFTANGESEELLFEVDEYNDTRILTLVNCDEYFVVRDDVKIHWSDFPTNVIE
jgi:hypothetical protein